MILLCISVTMDEKDKAQHNMISNLPLLFANGYPTSLEKITEPQLENFIPFMVQCSLGHINLPKKVDCSEPEWWPENAPFEIPLKKPKSFVGVSSFIYVFQNSFRSARVIK